MILLSLYSNSVQISKIFVMCNGPALLNTLQRFTCHHLSTVITLMTISHPSNEMPWQAKYIHVSWWVFRHEMFHPSPQRVNEGEAKELWQAHATETIMSSRLRLCIQPPHRSSVVTRHLSDVKAAVGASTNKKHSAKSCWRLHYRTPIKMLNPHSDADNDY